MVITQLIRDIGFTVSPGEDTQIVCTIAGLSGSDLPSTWTLASFYFKLDPEYPRYDNYQYGRSNVDISDWEMVLELDSFQVLDNGNGIIGFNFPDEDSGLLLPGYNRYVVDAWRLDDNLRWHIVKPTWCTVMNSGRL